MHSALSGWPFVIGRSYSRRDDIHRRYGGQQQGGISTPAETPAIFIFTGHGTAYMGYRDEFQPDGSFHYTAQGREGDMEMTRGNLAILDHVRNGKDLLLFSQRKKGALVRFEGLFVCAGAHTERQTDINGNDRNAIVFTLSPLASDEVDEIADPDQDILTTSLQELRQKAMQAAAAPSRGSDTGMRTVYARSRDVRNYVLQRANGVCESCHQPAPFLTISGQPYLEAHHIRRLSDGGPDDPGFVAGICPTCHRRAHHGADAWELNQAMQAAVEEKEKAASNQKYDYKTAEI